MELEEIKEEALKSINAVITTETKKEAISFLQTEVMPKVKAYADGLGKGIKDSATGKAQNARQEIFVAEIAPARLAGRFEPCVLRSRQGSRQDGKGDGGRGRERGGRDRHADAGRTDCLIYAQEGGEGERYEDCFLDRPPIFLSRGQQDTHNEGRWRHEVQNILVHCLGVVISFAIGWFLFRAIRSDGKRADDARSQLDAAGEGQRAAQDAVREISSGLADSADTVQGLADADRDAQETARRIADAGTGIASAVDAVQSAGVESRQLVDDSEQRIAESERIIRGIRERARADGGVAADTENSVADRER